MRFDLLRVAVFFVLGFSLLTTSYTLFETQGSVHVTTAKATGSGQVGLCINGAPTITVPCNTTMSQGSVYTCQLTGSDPENGTLSFSTLPGPGENGTIFNVSSSGLINFTPQNNDTGNHSQYLIVTDDSGCGNENGTSLFNFTIGNINDPPYLVLNIPDQEFVANSTLLAFFLTTYFADPDGDAMNFTYSRGTATVQINITLANDSSVRFTSSACGYAYFRFTATDPYNESATSNIILVNSTCAQAADEDSGGSGSGGGGGGGGGGGAFICVEELLCLPWSECYPNGLQRQICRDKNGCDPTEIKFEQNCTYAEEPLLCIENWLCSDWGACTPQEVQSRTCEDLEECGGITYRPALEQPCRYVPSCDDGVRNGNETGIDCGGECAPCTSIQEPASGLPGSRWATLMSLLWILVLVIIIALFTLYRERVYEAMARLGWYLARKRPKELFLTPAEKGVLFEGLRKLDAELKEGRLDVRKASDRLSSLIRSFYGFVFDLPFEYALPELLTKASHAKIGDETRLVLRSFHARLQWLEAGRAADLASLSSVEEEFRLLVCMYSEYSLEEVARELPSRVIDESLSFSEELRRRFLNAHEALQFRKHDQAEHEYLLILRAYEGLPEAEKRGFFQAVHRLYLEVKYAHETE